MRASHCGPGPAPAPTGREREGLLAGEHRAAEGLWWSCVGLHFGWSHTGCLGLVVQALCGIASVLVRWCPRQDSNLRPSAPEADALSPELRGANHDAAPLGQARLAHREHRSATAMDSGTEHLSQ